jgi:nifR3 family TIM-barrel protein
VVCKDAGAGILKNIPKMIRLTEAVVKGVSKPVTVKTRLGWDDSSKNIVEVAERLQDIGIKALSIHGRTRTQMYKGEADWTLIGEVKNNPRMKIPIFGNGDISTPQKALEMKNRYGIDGVMIGRASIGYPWIFNEIKHFLKTGEYLPPPTIDDRIKACLQHLDFSLKWKGHHEGIVEMRRHYSNYFRNIPHFKDFRQKLVTSMDENEIRSTLAEINSKFADYSFV